MSSLAADEVTISVDAWGVNFIDVLASSNLHPMISDDRFVLGHEVAGRVVAVGGDVEHINIGDRVAALVAQGGLATSVNTKARFVLSTLESWSPEESVSLLITGLTAIACIGDAGRIQQGERVLVQSAAGVVASPCCSISKCAT